MEPTMIIRKFGKDLKMKRPPSRLAGAEFKHTVPLLSTHILLFGGRASIGGNVSDFIAMAMAACRPLDTLLG
jgi:hypothetical protein